MMGRTHAVTGALAFQAAAGWFPATVPAVLLGTIICTGAALLPDIDHGDATTANTYGPVTRGLSVVVRKVSGGHRNGTHSVLGIGLTGLSAYQAVLYQDAPGWAGVIAKVWLSVLLILASAGAVRLLKIDGYADDFAPIPVCLALVWLAPVDLSWVPLAIMLGMAVHVAGDMLTNGGCPLFWPIKKGKGKRSKPARYALGLFKTNGWFENWIVLPLAIIGTVALIGWRIFG